MAVVCSRKQRIDAVLSLADVQQRSLKSAGSSKLPGWTRTNNPPVNQSPVAKRPRRKEAVPLDGYHPATAAIPFE
jgi:hypothetical protein